MAGLSYDDREVAGSDECPQLRVRSMNKRTGAIRDVEPGCAPGVSIPVRRPVRRDHDLARSCARKIVELAFADSTVAQPLPHDWIVHQFTEDSQRSGSGKLFSSCKRVAHAEAHAEMFSRG